MIPLEKCWELNMKGCLLVMLKDQMQKADALGFVRGQTLTVDMWESATGWKWTACSLEYVMGKLRALRLGVEGRGKSMGKSRVILRGRICSVGLSVLTMLG